MWMSHHCLSTYVASCVVSLPHSSPFLQLAPFFTFSCFAACQTVKLQKLQLTTDPECIQQGLHNGNRRIKDVITHQRPPMMFQHLWCLHNCTIESLLRTKEIYIKPGTICICIFAHETTRILNRMPACTRTHKQSLTPRYTYYFEKHAFSNTFASSHTHTQRQSIKATKQLNICINCNHIYI